MGDEAAILVGPAKQQDAIVAALDVPNTFSTASPETGMAGTRMRIGNRLYATLDRARGFYPRKLTLPLTSLFEDGSGLVNRLVGANAGDKIKALAPEVAGTTATRWRIGNRIYATLDRASGFYPRKATLPRDARVDDDLTASLAARLVGAGIGQMLKPLAPQAGGTIRIRWGNRLLGQYTKAGGMMWARQTLPVDCKIADQPTVALVDRLGGSNRAASVNANFVAMAAPAASGKTQITTRRRSTGALVPITPANATASYRAPVLTSDDMVLFDSDGDGRMMYAPAAGGAIWPVDPLSLIDCWGDSLTAGAGSNGSGAGQGPWPKQLADRLGAVVSAVNNRGVGGQNSAEIEARHGGTPALLTVTGNQIPASGPVTVTAYTRDLLFNSGISGSLSLVGTLAGVAGTLRAMPPPDAEQRPTPSPARQRALRSIARPIRRLCQTSACKAAPACRSSRSGAMTAPTMWARPSCPSWPQPPATRPPMCRVFWSAASCPHRAKR
jgi:hypothetical protein